MAEVNNRLLIFREVTEKYSSDVYRRLISSKSLEMDGDVVVVDVDRAKIADGEFDWIASIEQHKPTCVCTFGETIFQYVTGKSGIVKGRGKVVTISLKSGKVKVMPTFSELYVEKNDSGMMDWASDIYKAFLVSQGKVGTDEQKTKTIYCDDYDKIDQLVDYVKQTKICCFDFETTTIDEKKGTFSKNFKATVLSISFQHGSSYVIPLEHFESPFSRDQVFEIMGHLAEEIFENPDIDKVAHNANFDSHVLRTYGVRVRGRLDDTMLMHHVVDETSSHKLKDLVRTYFPEYGDYEHLVSDWKWDEVPLERLVPYAGIDTDLTLRFRTLFAEYLLRDTDSRSYIVYRNLSAAVLRPLFAAESEGMLIDVPFLESAIEEVEILVAKQETILRQHHVVRNYEEALRHDETVEAISELEDKLTKWKETHPKVTLTETKMEDKLRKLKSGELSVHESINFGSPKQLERLLYNHPSGFKFKNPDGGTGKDVLEDLNDDSGFVDDLLVLRSFQKMLGTYLRGIYDRLDENNRIHTSLLIHGTVSGRLSSRNPNLQNLPNIAKLKNPLVIKVVNMIKKCFIVEEDHTLLQLDYSQAELRIIAAFAHELNMIEAYRNGQDLHAKTAAALVGITLEEFYKLPSDKQKEYRTRAKAGNFGLIYGMGVNGFMDYAKSNYGVVMSEHEAEESRNIFFGLYPRLLDYHDEYVAKGIKFGYVRTLFGRRRQVPNIESSDNMTRSMDERVAINSPVQGTAGEFTIFAIALLKHRLHPRVKLNITVHDSIVFKVPDDLLEDTARIVKHTCENLPMKQYFRKELPHLGMKVDLEISKKNWKDLEPYTYPQTSN